MDNKLQNEFANPGTEYRGKPFWSWNGKLEKNELIRQIHVMKEMGFGGFFMHSRTGLKTEYLGEKWFDLINDCADEADALGMEAWLYDEDRWPSGIAGGMVTADSEYRMKSIKLTVEDSKDFKWNKDILAAFSCSLEDIDVYEYKRIFKDTPIDYYKGQQLLIFTVIEMSSHSFYNGYTYLDTLNRNATEQFIKLTHEKYRDRCGERLGRSIKGIFTDEPHRGTLMDEFGSGNDCDVWRAPWTDLLPQEFSRKFGYDLVERLPELFLRPDGRSVSQVKWHYVELLTQMFLDNFLIPINEWCTKNGIILTGHLLHEDSLTAQTAMNGSIMRSYEHMEYPGVDVLTEGNRNYWVVKQLSSAARQFGREMLLSELYGCTGWQMNFESHKAVGDWQALFGINLRCHHLSWYTMEGEAKRDYPASILHQSTWWKEYKHVEDYFSRIGLIMSQGKPSCDVLVLNPIESVWCQVYPGWAKMLEARDRNVTALEKKYRDLFYWLSAGHIDFDYGDEDIVTRHYRIGKDSEGKAVLMVGKALYKVVIVGGMTTIRSSVLNILKEFMQEGGKVIFAGDPPQYVDALESKDASNLACKAICTTFDRKSLIGAVTMYSDNNVEISNSENANIEDIYCQIREDDKNKYLMFLNTNRDIQYKNVRINLKMQGFAQEWICSTGEKYAVGCTDKNGYISITTDFPAGGEHVYVIVQENKAELVQKPQFIEKEAYKLEGPYEYELDEPNICVLDMASFRLGENEWNEETEILKVDRQIRKRLGMSLRGGEMLQPWFAKRSEFTVKEQLSLRFEFNIVNMPSEPIELVLERPENFEIRINNHNLETSPESHWWIDKCFRRISIPKEYLIIGLNIVSLEIAFNEGINLEALYLVGKFGVKLTGSKKTIITLPDRILAGDLVEQGLPFYSGKVTYALKIDRKISKEERAFLTTDSFEAACMKVVSENKEQLVGWKPYEIDITDRIADDGMVKLEVILTRRNTFGPLHQVPLHSPAYGPENFVTEGENFSEGYMLIPSGLLSEPFVSIRH